MKNTYHRSTVLIPVSYTHLDVYKRQPLNITINITINVFCIKDQPDRAHQFT